MLVFNLTTSPISFRGKVIPANGGCLDYPDMSFVPDRDRKLEIDRVLAFGGLPQWWLFEQELKRAQESTKQDIPVETIAVEEWVEPAPVTKKK